MSYSKQQLEAAWIRNGGNPSAASMAAAIAGAESNFGASPYGDQGLGGSGYTSFGPWQVHTPAHPQYSPQLLVSNLDYSTKAAIAISNNGRDWEPWSTYKNGAYRSFLGGGGGGGSAHNVSSWNPLDPKGFLIEPSEELFDKAGKTFKKATEPFQWAAKLIEYIEKLFELKTWEKIGKVLLGLFLLLAGVLGMANVSAPNPATVLEGGRSVKSAAVAAGLL